MAQAARQQQPRQALTIAPRHQKPALFGGTDVQWRVICDLYPAAETPEVVLAVIEYCAARKLDPLKRPVHVVPMWNSKLRRRVQVVMSGINELETTAHRTGLWAGMDMPAWGAPERRTFKGEQEFDDGTRRQTEIVLEFPSWCAVTVYRIVGGERRAFTEPVYWTEAYGRDGFRSTVPNTRWAQAPHQMLHKCAKAAALRAAFPEELAGGYAIEEMEDREIETGGITIDGVADHGDPGISDDDRRTVETPSGPPPGRLTLELLDEPNGTRWLAALRGLLRAAADFGELEAIQRHGSVVKSLAKDAATPSTIRQLITDEFKAAHDRLVAANAPLHLGDEPPDGDDAPTWSEDPIAELVAEIETMDLPTINGLATSAQWRARVREASDFPPDEDRINDAIERRKAALKHQ